MKRLARFLALGILLFLPLYYWRFNLVGLPTNFIEILVLILFGLTIVGIRPKRTVALSVLFPIILMLLGVVIGGLIASDHRTAFGIAKGWFLIPVIYYWCLHQLFNKDQFWSLAIVALTNVVAVSLYALAQWAGLVHLLPYQGVEAVQYLNQHRAIGFFESPNFLAMYLVPLTVFLWSYFQAKRQPWYWYVGLLLPVLAILVSGSRAGWAALVVGVVAYVIFLPSRFSTIIKAGLGVVAAGLLLLLFIMTLGRASNDQHLAIWQGALIIIRSHWLLGIGPGQFQSYFAALPNQTATWQAALPYALHPHNVFFNFWLSTGLLGLVGFIWLLVELTKRTLKGQNQLAISAWAAMVAIIAQGLFDSTYFKNDLAIWFYFFVFMIVCRAETENAKDL